MNYLNLCVVAGSMMALASCTDQHKSKDSSERTRAESLGEQGPGHSVDFFEAVTQTSAQYAPFGGYDALEAEAHVVAVGELIALAQGPVWRFKYPDPAMGAGYRNHVVATLRPTRTLKGANSDLLHIVFETGTFELQVADVRPPAGTFKVYLAEVNYEGNPEIDGPRKGVPSGATLYRIVRPEGMINQSGDRSIELPLTGHGRMLAPLTESSVDESAIPSSGSPTSAARQ